jgi:hypothetical protein
LTSAKVKEWSYTYVLPICLHDVDRDNFSLTFVVCGCERVINLKEEQRLMVFENGMLMKIHGPRGGSVGDWRQLHNEDLHDVFC